jgi:hypothetical protein
MSLSKWTLGFQLSGLAAIAVTAPRAPPALVIAVIVCAIIVTVMGNFVNNYFNTHLQEDKCDCHQCRRQASGASMHSFMLCISIGVALLAGTGKLTSKKSTMQDVLILVGAFITLALLWLVVSGSKAVFDIYGIPDAKQGLQLPLLAASGLLVGASAATAVHLVI